MIISSLHMDIAGVVLGMEEEHSEGVTVGMPNRQSCFGGNRHGHLLRLHAELIALAASKGVTVVFEEQKQPSVEAMVQDFKLAVQPLLKEPLFEKESAYQRRNRGQKWWRQFTQRKHK